MIEGLFTDEEQARVIISFVHGEPKTEEQICRAVSWARETRVMNHFLDGVLSGEILLTLEDGEMAFKAADENEQKEMLARFLVLSVATDEGGNFRKENINDNY